MPGYQLLMFIPSEVMETMNDLDFFQPHPRLSLKQVWQAAPRRDKYWVVSLLLVFVGLLFTCVGLMVMVFLRLMAS